MEDDGLRKRPAATSEFDTTVIDVDTPAAAPTPRANSTGYPPPRTVSTPDSQKRRLCPVTPSRTLRRSVIVAFWLIILLVFSILGFYFGWKSSTGTGELANGTDLLFFNTTKTEAASCIGYGVQSNSSSTLVAYTVVSVDLVNFELPLRFMATTCGGELEDADGLATMDIQFTVDLMSFLMAKGLPAIEADKIQDLTGGPLWTYPFDIWTATLNTNSFVTSANGTKVKVPIGVSVDAVSTSYNVRVTAVSGPTDAANRGPLAGGLQIQIQISRTAVSITLVIMIAVSMWALSVSMLVTALDAAYIRPHRIEADVVGASISLLFALPQLRDAMPAVPSLGFAQVDVFAYSVCLLISAVAAIILLWEFLARTRVVEKDEEEGALLHVTDTIEDDPAVVRHATLSG